MEHASFFLMCGSDHYASFEIGFWCILDCETDYFCRILKQNHYILTILHNTCGPHIGPTRTLPKSDQILPTVVPPDEVTASYRSDTARVVAGETACVDVSVVCPPRADLYRLAPVLDQEPRPAAQVYDLAGKRSICTMCTGHLPFRRPGSVPPTHGFAVCF